MIVLAIHWLRALLVAIQQRKSLLRLALLTTGVLVLVLQVILFGYGPTRRGGQLGRFVDNAIRRTLFERAVRRHEDGFQQYMGYPLPELAEEGANQVGVHVLLHSWLSETLMRTKTRVDAVDRLANQSHDTSSGCSLPLIHPMMGDWYRPIEWEQLTVSLLDNTTISTPLRVLSFDDEQIAAFMSDHFEQMYYSFYQSASREVRIQLFGMAAIYVFGGILVSPFIRDSTTLEKAAPGFHRWIRQTSSDCKPGIWFQTINMQAIGILAATPKHPTVLCVFQELLESRNDDWQSVFHLMDGTRWDPTCTPKCCRLQNTPVESREVMATIKQPEPQPHDGPRFLVTIREAVEAKRPESPSQPKNRCSDRLGKIRCSAGWFCNRCLRMPFLGSLSACRFVCRSCYSTTVCQPAVRDQLDIEVSVAEKPNSTHKRIPRIIHQTWFEELTTMRYPHLQRLQNSWRAAGWDYRFYNDSACQEYIANAYPRLFVEAYDAILPGAFKADFFRLLVLFKEGGVYADVDVQLDADLDNFITKDLSFFVPRDVPLDYWPNSNYCLWNGLLGAAPGHPIIAKAIEDVLTTVLNRVDYYDIEGSLCSNSASAEIWKLRTLPILILTGPCALGMSVNAALGADNILSGHKLGWLDAVNISARHEPVEHFWGDALTLLADRYDLGELRFTDIDRNLLVASTNQDRISKTPIKGTNDARLPEKTPIHYSKSETDIVGEYSTYKDSLVTNQTVRIHITHAYAP